MAVVHRLGERKGDPGAHADQRGLLDSELGRDSVDGPKAVDIAGQTVWVFRDRLNPIGAIDFSDAHRARGADAVAVQEQHDLADHLRLGRTGDDPFRPLWADPLTSASRPGFCAMT